MLSKMETMPTKQATFSPSTPRVLGFFLRHLPASTLLPLTEQQVACILAIPLCNGQML